MNSDTAFAVLKLVRGRVAKIYKGAFADVAGAKSYATDMQCVSWLYDDKPEEIEFVVAPRGCGYFVGCYVRD